MIIFSKDAIKNIEKTGNVWGHTTEYDFKFNFRILNRVFYFEQRSDKFMGRFGGGWSFKVGVQAVSFKKFLLLDGVIFSLFTMSIMVSKPIETEE